MHLCIYIVSDSLRQRQLLKCYNLCII